MQSFVIDPHSEVDRSIPNWYYYTNYHGLLKNALLVEAQYSERRFRADNDGGTSTNIVDSPFFALQLRLPLQRALLRFDRPAGPQQPAVHRQRDEFWMAGGRHETKGGYEFFRSQLTGGGSQSVDVVRLQRRFSHQCGGPPVLDSTGRLIPVFVPGQSFARISTRRSRVRC